MNCIDLQNVRKMFRSIFTKTKEQNKKMAPEKISFDFKIMFVYHITMMLLFVTHAIDKAFTQAMLALALGIILVIVSVWHKQKTNWKWPGLKPSSLPKILFNLIVMYAFFSIAAHTARPKMDNFDFNNPDYLKLITDSWRVILKAASDPFFTPWYLAGVGICVFNLLSDLNLIDKTIPPELEKQKM